MRKPKKAEFSSFLCLLCCAFMVGLIDFTGQVQRNCFGYMYTWISPVLIFLSFRSNGGIYASIKNRRRFWFWTRSKMRQIKELKMHTELHVWNLNRQYLQNSWWELTEVTKNTFEKWVLIPLKHFPCLAHTHIFLIFIQNCFEHNLI